MFLNYPDMGLFGQKVNSIGLITSNKKLKAIYFLIYPNTLGALEYYLDLTGYLQSYMHFYAQLAAPLQELKTLFQCHALIASKQRKGYTLKTKLGSPTSQELAFF